jgi:arylsulfatase A-like enzyme
MPPNVILFLTDQLRRDALGCYGNQVCRTPHLDRLAEEGFLFENAFTTSPVCSPARASLLTGLYPHTHGVMLNTHIAPAWSKGLSPEVPTFSSVLQEAGYALDYVGKWHVHQEWGPEKFGFARHLSPRCPREVVPGTELTVEFPGGSQLVGATSALPAEEHRTWKLTDTAITLLEERARESRPFFLRVDTDAPHFANVVPEPYASMYDPSAIPPWPNFEESFAGKPAGHLRKHREWHLEEKGWDWWSQVVAKYYGDVSLIDSCVGRLLQAVRERGLEESTVFLFSTDHGDALGSHRHFEKAGTMYDEVYRIPLLVKMPALRRAAPAFGGHPGLSLPKPAGLSRGRRLPPFVRLLDLMPTLVELAGAELPRPPAGGQPVQGRSLLALLRGEEPADWPDSVYCEHHGEVWGYQSQRMVRTAGWKYVYNPHDLDELYNLRDDPGELANLAERPEFAGVREEMQARLLGWNDATGDMFRWSWVRWNFPKAVLPSEVTPARMPLTSG